MPSGGWQPRDGKGWKALSFSLVLFPLALAPRASRRGTPAVSRRGTRPARRTKKKDLTPNYTRRLTK